MHRHVLIERDLISAVTPPPEPVAVACLVHRDAVNPGAQARLPAKAMDRTEHAEEDFLRQVEGLVAVAEQADRELDDHALVLAHQVGTGRLVAARTAPHERRLAAVYIGPPSDPDLFHGRVHYTKLRPRPGLEVPLRKGTRAGWAG